MSYNNVGQSWTTDALREELKSIKPPQSFNAVVLHHTAAPSLAQRPKGFTAQHIINIRSFYQSQLGWSSGPHLFVDEYRLWGMCPFNERGVHAVSFNRRAIGIEVLGNYDREDPLNGRGLACWNNAAAATRILLDWLGLKPNAKTVLFHRDDPKTSKSCPGKKVSKDWVLEMV